MHKIGEATKEVDYEIELTEEDYDEIRNKVSAARFRTMSEYPFYGTFIVQMGTEETQHPDKITTMATNGYRIWYNPHFVKALTMEEVIFVFAHEVLHNVLKHLVRRGTADPSLWNSAGDYVINKMLVDAGVGKFPAIGGLYDETFEGMATDQVYQILIERAAENGGGGASGSGGGSGSVQGSGGGDNGNFDQHVEIGKNPDGSTDEEVDGMTDDQIEESYGNDMDQLVQEAIKLANNMDAAGNVPAAIKRMIAELNEPRVPWRDLVHSVAQAQIRTDYSFKRPNMKLMQLSGVIVPTRSYDEHFEFTVGVDTSGSISTELLQDFMTELYYISTSFKSFEINVFQFDTKAYQFKTFTQDNIEEIAEYEIVGGGGTDFMACWREMRKREIKPRTFIMLTDGYPWDSWGEEDYADDNIFLIHEPSAIKSKIRAPFGTTVYYDDFEPRAV